MGHIQSERLPKSKMASSDDRFTLEIVRVLRFGNELNKELEPRSTFTFTRGFSYITSILIYARKAS